MYLLRVHFNSITDYFQHYQISLHKFNYSSWGVGVFTPRYLILSGVKTPAQESGIKEILRFFPFIWFFLIIRTPFLAIISKRFRTIKIKFQKRMISRHLCKSLNCNVLKLCFSFFLQKHCVPLKLVKEMYHLVQSFLCIGNLKNKFNLGTHVFFTSSENKFSGHYYPMGVFYPGLPYTPLWKIFEKCTKEGGVWIFKYTYLMCDF